ncbi:UNVERIFIED_CONTAM: hypothetical protein FKN15_054554 [Acipenser sinensis]
MALSTLKMALPLLVMLLTVYITSEAEFCTFFIRSPVKTRMDENYNIVPHGVNFQDPIFTDTAENRRMFASLFQFANCSSGTQIETYTPDWEFQEDSRLLCSTVQKALFEEEERVKTLSQKVRSLEKANNHLKDKVKKMKRSIQQAKKESKQEALLIKQQREKEKAVKQDTSKDHLKKPLKKIISNKLKK